MHVHAGLLGQCLPALAGARAQPEPNSDDGSWNSLMTTISESSWVDEGHLVPALDAQCVVADANQNANPQEPGGKSGGGAGGSTTTVPRNVNPNPASPG